MSEQIIGFLNWRNGSEQSVEITMDEQGKFWGYKLANGLIRFNKDGSSELFDCKTMINNGYRAYSEDEIVSVGEKIVETNGEVVANVIFRFDRCEVKQNSKTGTWSWVVEDVVYLAEGEKFNADFAQWYAMEHFNLEARGYTIESVGFKYFDRKGFIVEDEGKTSRLYVAKRLNKNGSVAKKSVKIGLSGNHKAVMEQAPCL